MKLSSSGLEKLACVLLALPLLILTADAQSRGKGRTDSDDTEAALEKVKRKVVVQGKVCPDPDRPCRVAAELGIGDFRPNELSFRIDTKFSFDRGQDRSQPFYAVILNSGTLCSISEEQRVKVQSEFPGRKVFVHRYFCEEFADNVSYTNVNAKYDFIAVYAGETEVEAKRFLAQVSASGRFPGANIRRMQVVVVHQLE